MCKNGFLTLHGVKEQLAVAVKLAGTVNVIPSHGGSSEVTVTDVVHPISLAGRAKETAQVILIVFQAWCVVVKTAPKELVSVTVLIAVSSILTHSTQSTASKLSSIGIVKITNINRLLI